MTPHDKHLLKGCFEIASENCSIIQMKISSIFKAELHTRIIAMYSTTCKREISSDVLQNALHRSLLNAEYAGDSDVTGSDEIDRRVHEGAEHLAARMLGRRGKMDEYRRFITEAQPSRQQKHGESNRGMRTERASDITLTGTTNNYAQYVKQMRKHRSGA